MSLDHGWLIIYSEAFLDNCNQHNHKFKGILYTTTFTEPVLLEWSTLPLWSTMTIFSPSWPSHLFEPVTFCGSNGVFSGFDWLTACVGEVGSFPRHLILNFIASSSGRSCPNEFPEDKPLSSHNRSLFNWGYFVFWLWLPMMRTQCRGNSPGKNWRDQHPVKAIPPDSRSWNIFPLSWNLFHWVCLQGQSEAYSIERRLFLEEIMSACTE